MNNWTDLLGTLHCVKYYFYSPTVYEFDLFIAQGSFIHLSGLAVVG